MNELISTPRSDVDAPSAWHSVAQEDVLRRLETSAERGLSSDEARERLERDGPNRLPEAERESALIRFLKQFHNVLIYVLLGAAVVAALLGIARVAELAAGWRSAVASRWHTAARSPARVRSASIFICWLTTGRLNPRTA